MIKTKQRRIKTVEAKISALEAKHPGVNFKDMELRQAFEAHFAFVKELIYLRVDVTFCQSENRHEMCSGCNCWKAAAARCG
jgi:hypothetical protein